MKNNIAKLTMIVASLFILACTARSKKAEDALLNDLSKATTIIAHKNERRLEKVKAYYNSDSTSAQTKAIYKNFLEVHENKNLFIKNIEAEEADLMKLSIDFVTNSVNHLSEEKKKDLITKITGSTIQDMQVLQEKESPALLIQELKLDAEIFIQEYDHLILGDLAKDKKGFEWEIYWE